MTFDNDTANTAKAFISGDPVTGYGQGSESNVSLAGSRDTRSSPPVSLAQTSADPSATGPSDHHNTAYATISFTLDK
jgi:hypothetical protein